jgi:hypothetical protein
LGGSILVDLSVAPATPEGAARTAALAEADLKVEALDAALSVKAAKRISTLLPGRLCDKIAKSREDGIRVDLRTRNPTTDEVGQVEIWADVSGVHLTSRSLRHGTLSHLTKDLNRRLFGAPSLRKKPPAPPPGLHSRSLAKHKKYAGLLGAGTSLHSLQLLPTPPTFLGIVFSTNGTLHPDFESLLNQFIEAFHTRTAWRGDRDDGRTPAQLTRRFKRGMLDSICFTLLAGRSRACRDAGVPNGRSKKRRGGVWTTLY